MAEEAEETWLSAQAAVALIAPMYERRRVAEAALIEVAAFGGLRTRCRESLIQTEAGSEVPFEDGGSVNKSFWRSFQDPLGNQHEDWAAGNFTAKYRTSKGAWQWTRLRGVEFSEPDIRNHFGLKAGPPAPTQPSGDQTQPPPQVAQASPSALEGHDWIPAADAIDLILPLYEHPTVAQQALIAEAASSRIASWRERFERETDDDDDQPIENTDGGELHFQFWRDFQRFERDREDWLVGSFAYRDRPNVLTTRWTRAFGVHFCVRDIGRVFRLRDETPTLVQSLGEAFKEGLRGSPAYVAPKTTPSPPASVVSRRRHGERKAIQGLPFVPDDRLTAWYQKDHEAHPADVYRRIRPRADKYFKGRYRVGKNQLYDIMRAVQGGLTPGKR